jgi:hypothetical protein
VQGNLPATRHKAAPLSCAALCFFAGMMQVDTAHCHWLL